MNLRLRNCSERCEKIEIAALIGLAARVMRRGLLPGSAALGDFLI